MKERQKLEHAMRVLDEQRDILGDDVVNVSQAALREKLTALEEQGSAPARRQVTILFADIVGSTWLGESLDPEEVMEIMDGALRIFVGAVQDRHGEVSRLMGDGLLAFFGARRTLEDDAERAVWAGLDIIEATRAYSATLTREADLPEIAVRVGLNTGLVALGEVGSTGAHEYTAMGDPINLAARIEKMAPDNGLLISHDTYQHVRGLFEFVPQKPLPVKGKQNHIRTYLVLRPVQRSFRMATRGVETIETRLVGREMELQSLRNHFKEAIKNRKTTLLTIVGDAGIGKSRLLFEFERWLESQELKPSVLKARASPATQSVPYGLIRELFAFRYGIQETDGRAEVKEKFRSGMGGILPASRADIIGHFIGFDFADSSAVRPLLGDTDYRSLAIAYLKAYFRDISSTPTILLLEDIHWADASSLDLVDQLVKDLPSSRLFIACLARPDLKERRPDWGGTGENFPRIDLKPLTPEYSRDLVEQLLRRVNNLPPKLLESIVDSADGNPYFVEELINILLDQGIIQRDEPHWLVTKPNISWLKIPGTLRGLLHARLDLLPVPEKVLLQRASIIGKVFWDAVLRELAADIQDDSEIDGLLSSLLRKEMIYQRQESKVGFAREFTFKHAILRDAVYETVLLRQRNRYHHLVARWLERHFDERIGEYLSLIAQHYELAGEPSKAAEYLGRSGLALLNVGAARDGQKHLVQALALLPEEDDSEGRATFTVHLGHAYFQGGDLMEAEHYLKAGLELAEQTGQVGLQAEALGFLSAVAQRRGNYQEAEYYDGQSLNKASAVGNRQQIGSALHGLCTSRYLQDDYEGSAAFAEQAIQSFREIGNRRGEALSLNMLGLLAGEQRDFDLQQEYYQQALAAFREIGDLARGAVVLNNLGSSAYLQGEHTAAIRYTREALEILEDLGQTYYIAFTLVSQGLAFSSIGEIDSARENQCRALEIAQDIHSEQIALFALAGMADYLATVGNHLQAAELLGLVLNHPGVNLDIRKDAQTAFNRIQEALPEAVFQETLKAGAKKELMKVVEQILEKCPVSDSPDIAKAHQ